MIDERDNKELLPKLLVVAINEFAPLSSSRIFSEMRGKIKEKSNGDNTRKSKILDVIHRRLTPRQKQVREHGEVFTPLELIEKLMDHLPKGVWSNPDLKWLDPANGIGNFPVVVFYRLDEGLKTWQSDAKKRRKHIIENMLYMMELQSGNNRVARNIFKELCGDCNPNIITADSTSPNILNVMKSHHFPEKFDIVIGNPPFQKGRNMMFYDYFITLANRLLKDNGYLVYVIPNKILIPNKVNESIRELNPLIIYHTINSKYFPSIATTICAVICKKEPFENKTEVIFENGKKTVDLTQPTPTQYNDIHLKNISDKIFFGEGREHLQVSTEKPAGNTFYISRVWVRYSPDKPAGGTHVFNISENSTGDGGRYVVIPEGISKDTLKWYLSRSEVMRFLTKIYAGAMNVPAFIWSIIPFVQLKHENNDEVYELMGLNNSDKQLIKKVLNDNVHTEEETVAAPQDTASKGGRRTRKFKRRS